MAAQDPTCRSGRERPDRLLSASSGSDSLQVMGDGAPARRSGRSAPTTTERGPDSWRRLIAVAVGLVTLLAVFGLSRLKIDDDLRSLLRDSDADFRLVDEVAGGFGAPDRECIVHVAAESGDLFDAPSIAAIRSLTGRLKALDGVEQVRSMFDIRRQGIAGAILPVIPQVEGELRVSDGQAARAQSGRDANRDPARGRTGWPRSAGA